MKILLNSTADVISEIARFRAKVVRIWVLRAFMSGLLAGLVSFSTFLLVTKVGVKIPLNVFLISLIPAIFVFTLRLRNMYRSVKHVPEFLDSQVSSDSSILTAFEMNRDNQTDKPFYEFVKHSASEALRTKKLIDFKVLSSSFELILIVFLALISSVLLIFSKSEEKPLKSFDNNDELLAQLVEIDAMARVNNDKNLLKMISETKAKLLRGEINSISELLLKIDKDLEQRQNANKEASVFIENLEKSEENKAELQKKAFELAQKQILQSLPEMSSQDDKKQLMTLDLDELIEILKKNLVQDEKLQEKIDSLLKRQRKTIDKSSNNSASTKEDLWVYNKFKPAKVDIITSGDNSSIIDYHAVTDKFESFAHTKLRKRIIAELNANN